jgi:hypothetical protein
LGHGKSLLSIIWTKHCIIFTPQARELCTGQVYFLCTIFARFYDLGKGFFFIHSFIHPSIGISIHLPSKWTNSFIFDRNVWSIKLVVFNFWHFLKFFKYCLVCFKSTAHKHLVQTLSYLEYNTSHMIIILHLLLKY